MVQVASLVDRMQIADASDGQMRVPRRTLAVTEVATAANRS